MAIVNDAKLEALASFIVNNEVNGNCACCLVLDQMSEEMQKEVNAPCKSSNYEDEWCYDCPFWSKDGFLYWIEQDRKSSIKEIKRPKAVDFSEHIDNYDDTLIDYPNYAKALERYCNELEKALDKACEYTHESALNGCPFNYDISAITNEKTNECNICDYQCISLDEALNSSKEYLKKSMKCWKEYFLK